MVFVKQFRLFHLSFNAKCITKKCEVQERKEAFLDYKNTDFKKVPNLHNSKGVSPWFLSKQFRLSPPFVLVQNRSRKRFW